MDEPNALKVAVFDRMVLGRGVEASVELPDRRVSKAHALLERAGEGWRLRDLGSNNGTQLNGTTVPQADLRDGDVIGIGPYRLRFQLLPTLHAPVGVVVAPGAAPTVTASIVTHADRVFPPASALDAESLQRGYDKLRIAHELAQHIGFEKDAEAVLNAILRFALKLVDAHWAAALSQATPTSTQEDSWTVRAVQRASGFDDDESIVVSRTVVGRVWATREALLVEDAARATDLKSARSIVESGARSVLAVPVVVGKRTEAVIMLANARRPQAFDAQDLEILATVAAQAGIALERAELAVHFVRESERRARLMRYVSPAVADEIARGSRDLSAQEPTRCPVVVLFADIRGFTGMAEKLGPEDTFRMLNEYFEVTVDSIFRHRGVVDKYVGDMVMAWWGGVTGRPDDAERALACSIDILQRLAMLNTRREAQGRPRIEAGIGVHGGTAVVGSLGTPQRLEYTVIGDTVNVASRLCAMATADQVLTTHDTIAPFAARLVVQQGTAPVSVKGRTGTVKVCAVQGWAPGDAG